MITSLDLATLIESYTRGDFRPANVINHVYDRIAQQGERPVWISLRTREEALMRADAAPRGPLYGIPFAIKDNIDIAGLPTTCGCPDFAYMPGQSANVVARLEAAGAIAIGKTNLDQFATGLVGTRSPYGVPRSVFNPDYISGGSSSGSAVAVAGGLVSFALGTDTAGSGRVPAAFNNIVGLKPTKGLISTGGVFPACRSQDVVSIFALTAGDAGRVLSVAEAFDSGDGYSRRRPDACGPLPRRVRIGVPREALEYFGDLEAETLYRDAVLRLRAQDVEIVDVSFAPFRDAAALLYQGPWVAERLAALKEFVQSKQDSLDPVVRGIISCSETLTAVDAFEGFYKLADLQRSAEAEWLKMDALLLPTTGATYRVSDVLADPVTLNSNLGYYTNFVNLMDLSAVAVPAGFRSNGLPFGVTVIAAAFEESPLLILGDHIHRSVSGSRLGGTGTLVETTPVFVASIHSPSRVRIAVAGAHLSGQPLNWQLTDRRAHLIATMRTSHGYRLYALADTTPPKPGLVFDGTGAGKIEVEIWDMDARDFGSFVALIPAPLGIGTLQLDNGGSCHGFVCEAYAVVNAEDITHWGGWRAWLQSRAAGGNPGS